MARSGQLGLVKLLGEASIGSGVRRIEALVGIDAFRFLARESVLVNQLSEQLKARPEELPERISNVVTRLRDAERELARLKSAQLLEASAQIAAAAENIGGVAFVAHRVPDGTDADSIRRLALDVRSKIPALQPAVVALHRHPGGPAGRGHRGERGGARVRPRRGHAGRRARPGHSAAEAAASPTSRRAAARPVPEPAAVNAAFESIRSSLAGQRPYCRVT